MPRVVVGFTTGDLRCMVATRRSRRTQQRRNIAKRRRQNLDAQKATGVAGVSVREATDEKIPQRLIERKAMDAGEQVRDGAIICPACGTIAARGSVCCANCTEALCERETVAAARQTLSVGMRAATGMVIRWVDRGISSMAPTIRARYKKYYDRAIAGIKKEGGWMTFYESVTKRFDDDESFREDMVHQGWDVKSICLIDAIALLPAQENPGRTRAERAVYEDYYHVYPDGAAVDSEEGRFLQPTS